MKNKMTVYLAGGMHSDWQSKLITQCNGMFNFMDPRENRAGRVMTAYEYVYWDVNRMDHSDIFFLYLEKGNPGGHASMVEAGYMIGQGKSGIFVNEQHDNRYTTFLETMPRVLVQPSFDLAVEFLASMRDTTWNKEI